MKGLDARIEECLKAWMDAPLQVQVESMKALVHEELAAFAGEVKTHVTMERTLNWHDAKPTDYKPMIHVYYVDEVLERYTGGEG